MFGGADMWWSALIVTLWLYPVIGIVVMTVFRCRKYPETWKKSLRLSSFMISTYVAGMLLVQHYWR